MEINLTEKDSRQVFLNKLRYYLKREKPDSIIVNIYLATAIQESKDYIQSKSFDEIQKEVQSYLIGTIYGVDCYINPHLRWDDKRIFLQKEIKVEGSTENLL